MVNDDEYEGLFVEKVPLKLKRDFQKKCLDCNKKIGVVIIDLMKTWIKE